MTARTFHALARVPFVFITAVRVVHTLVVVAVIHVATASASPARQAIAARLATEITSAHALAR